MKNAKKLLALLLALALCLGLLAGCSNNSSSTPDPASTADSTPVDEGGEAAYAPMSYEDEVVYMNALNDFYDALTVAQNCADKDEMYALMAIAEAKMLEAAVVVPYYSDGGNYGITHIAPGSIPTVMWGSDNDRFDSAIVTNELIKVEDRSALRDMWNDLKGTGTYEAEAKAYLTEKGYTFNNEFVYAYSSDPETYDMLSAWTNTVGEPVCLTVENLAKYDMENVLHPALAESWEVSDDGLVWTFHLREGLKWVDSQGREFGDIVADDWVASLQHMFDFYGDSAAEVLAPMIVNGLEYCSGDISDFSEVGVEAVDDQTLVYTLVKPVPSFESLLTYCGFMPPLSRSYYESQGGTFGPEHDNGNYGVDTDHILYCGPYIITSHTDENSFVFDANPAYWNKDNINVTKVTFRYYDGTDPLATYNDCVAGNLTSAGLGTSALKKCQEDGLFEEYGNYTSALSGTTRQALYNLNRQIFNNANDETVAVSPQTHESFNEIDKENGVFTSDIQDDAARTHLAMANQNFRLALATGWDKASYHAQVVGDELKTVALRNTYTPGNFVQIESDVSVKINGTDTTFAAGTYYGAMVQAQITADGYPMKVWDPALEGGLGSSDSFDGWYDVNAARDFMAKAVEELAAAGVEVTAENPIQIDYVYSVSAESFINRANAYKQNIESALQGLVQVNLVSVETQQEMNYSTFWISNGSECNADITIGQAWSADYADPASYLATIAPYGDGYMTRDLGLW